jgi:flavodoxin
VVVYESMYGSTHQVAGAIGAGLGTAFEVSVVPVSQAGPQILGARTWSLWAARRHAHGMSRAGAR